MTKKCFDMIRDPAAGEAIAVGIADPGLRFNVRGLHSEGKKSCSADPPFDGKISPFRKGLDRIGPLCASFLVK